MKLLVLGFFEYQVKLPHVSVRACIYAWVSRRDNVCASACETCFFNAMKLM